jgi:hypothetical protein
LPDDSRRAVAATVIGRLGTLWLGDTTTPDDAVTKPAYADDLVHALREHRHLTTAG